MLKKRRLRRTVGAVLIISGGILMWLAPQTAFARASLVGAVLLVAGVALEALGIAIEHRDTK